MHVCMHVYACMDVCVYVYMCVCMHRRRLSGQPGHLPPNNSLPPFATQIFWFAYPRGHPFMTSTRSGEGVRLRWTGGGGSSPMWTSTQKIKIRVHRRHSVFFSCKEVGVFFYPNFVFGRNNK